MALALVSSSPRLRVVHGQGVTKVVITPQTGVVSFVGMIAVFAFWTFGGLFALLMLLIFEGSRSRRMLRPGSARSGRMGQ